MIRTSGQIFMPEKSTENNGKPQIRYYDTEKFANLALDEKTGASIALSIDTNTYIMTVALKNADGTVISSGQIDFPIESVVVNATYKDGVLTLILENGNSVNVDISDIISGLVSDVQVNGVSVVTDGVANITKASLGLGNVNNTADVNKVVHGATVLTNQDLNNYKTAALVGWYYAAGGNTVKNKPSGVGEFGLEVVRAANGVFVQRLTYGNKLYQRTYSGSSWNSWIEYANTTGTYPNLTAGKANIHTSEQLANNANLNTYYGESHWGRLYYAAGSNTISNRPIANSTAGFALEVLRGAGGVTIQRCTLYTKGNSANIPVTFTRGYVESSWTDWEEVAEANGTYPNMTVGKATNAINATNDSNGDKIVDTYAKIIQVANPNLIINPDFRINQRGQKSYSGTKIYTVDRWKTYNNITFNAETKTITNNETSAAAFLMQFSEDFNTLYGKTVSLSCLIDNVRYSTSISVGSSYSSNQVIGYIGTSNAKFELGYNSTNGIFVQFRLNAGTSAVVDECKLEIGSVATAFMPSLIAEELPKCQRYGLLLASGPVRYPNTQIDASIIDFTIPTPSSLRTKPTLSSTANIVVYNPDSSMAAQSGFKFEIVHTTSNAICIRASKSAHGLSRAVLGFTANVFLDAEL